MSTYFLPSQEKIPQSTVSGSYHQCSQKPPGLLVLRFVAYADGGNVKSCSGLVQKLIANILRQCSNVNQHSVWPGMMQDKNV